MRVLFFLASADLIYIQAICIAPSRELALQIVSVVQKMGEYTPVEVFHAGRDTIRRGMPKLHHQIIVGTPGTIIDVSPVVGSQALGFHPWNSPLTTNRCSVAQMIVKSRVLDVSKIKCFVLDEADNMLDQGTMGEQSIQVKK
jgi:ATP-dependent RNA helicase DDX19/DBP5